MALSYQRRATVTVSTNGVRDVNQENNTKLGAAGKGNVRSFGTRSALGNVSNKQSVNNKLLGVQPRKAAQKDEVGTFRPRRGLSKSTATSSLLPVVEKKQPAQKKKQLSPPTDVRSDTSSFKLEEVLIPHHVANIDKEDEDNPQLVSEYVNEIYSYMRYMERLYSVKERYLEHHAHINGKMRTILIDWLAQVHSRFHLLQETLYLTVDILDRFLMATKDISREKLQLAGVTAMLLASKYEEMYAPEVNDFVYITDNAYTAMDIRKMECYMLKSLEFNFGKPLPLHFLRRNSKAGYVDAEMHTLAKYLMELTLPEYDFAHIYPSAKAAAALYLTLQLLSEEDNWNETLAFYSGYSKEQILPTACKLAALVTRSETAKQQFIRTKYTSSKFMKISTLPQLKSRIVTELAEKCK